MSEFGYVAFVIVVSVLCGVGLFASVRFGLENLAAWDDRRRRSYDRHEDIERVFRELRDSEADLRCRVAVNGDNLTRIQHSVANERVCRAADTKLLLQAIASLQTPSAGSQEGES